MYQVSFSDQSIGEFNKLNSAAQLILMDQLGSVDVSDLKSSSAIGKFERNNTTFYRLRSKDIRVYFEIKPENVIFCHYILHEHSLTDFLFRFKLPVSEEQMLEQHQSFWKYLETLKNDS